MTNNNLSLSIADAARRLGVGRSTLYALFRDGRLTPLKIGRRTVVAASDLERFVADLASAAKARA
jgi:excisionase family DNA binding protein